MDKVVSVDEVVKTLLALRKQLVHALGMPKISPAKFNDIKQQLVPLNEQLRRMGIDLDPVPQMTYLRPTRAQRRDRKRAHKWESYESRVRQKLAKAYEEQDNDANT